MTAIVTTRTARKCRACSRCDQGIDPGDRYELSSLPPDDNEVGNTTWWHHGSHVGAWLPSDRTVTEADHARIGIGCDEAAAYREARARLLATSCLLPKEALNA